MEKDKKRFTGWMSALTNLAAMLLISIVLMLLLFRWMNHFTRHGEYITVPDVACMTEDEAAEIIMSSGLRYKISDFKYDSKLSEGQIIEQRPKAGSNVKAERIIHLTVNSGKIPGKALPDVADNSSLRAAESKLLGAGFKLTEPEFIPGDADWVYEVRLGDRVLLPGEEVPEGSTLTIVVGDGTDALEADSLMTEGLDSDFFL